MHRFKTTNKRRLSSSQEEAGKDRSGHHPEEQLRTRNKQRNGT